MLGQIFWVLTSAAAVGLVWFPRLGMGKMKILTTWAGIGIFSISWFWLPFTSQPRIVGQLGIALASIGVFFFIIGLTLCVMATRKITGAVGMAGHAEPSKLITSGTYGVVRHPVYSGLFLGMFGWSLIWGGVYSTLLMPILYSLFRMEAWLEERLTLKRHFGEAYDSYQKKVPAFFPVVLVIPLLIISLAIILGIILGRISLV